jgi:hypothetical protein
MHDPAAHRPSKPFSATVLLAGLALFAAVLLAPAAHAQQCTFALDPPDAFVPDVGGVGLSFTVTTGPLCAWNVLAIDPWITVTSATGAGPGSVTFDVEPNPGEMRIGTILVENEAFTVYQEGIQAPPCTYELVPGAGEAPAEGAAGLSFEVLTDFQCAWTAVSPDPWITVVEGGGGEPAIAGQQGFGPGMVVYDVEPNPGEPRYGTIFVEDQPFLVSQEGALPPECTLILQPAELAVPSSGGTGLGFTVSTDPQCAWAAATQDPWIAITSGAGAGPGVVTFDVAPNLGTERVGTILVEDDVFTVTQAAFAACEFVLTPQMAPVAASGATGLGFSVSTDPQCDWGAVTEDGWITIAAGTGVGPGSVTFDVAPNPGPERFGTIVVESSVFTVVQAGGCAAGTSLDPTFASVPEEGSAGLAFQVNSPEGCPWVAVAVDPWIVVTSGGSGEGNGTVTFDVAPNEGQGRSGTILAAGLDFRVSQGDGCEGRTTLVPEGATAPVGGATGLTFAVQAPGACPWTAFASAPWITVVSGFSGLGNGTVAYNVAPNPGPPRVGAITAGGRVFTVAQGDGCIGDVTLFPDRVSVPSAGGSGLTFQVQTGAGCPWTAVPGVPWISVTAGAAGAGEGTVTYAVAPNDGPARQGAILVSGKAFLVEQELSCSVAVPALSSYPLAPVVAGSSFTIAWQPVPGLPELGYYEVAVSTQEDCASPTVLVTAELGVTIATESSLEASYCVRVRALAGPECGEGFVSGFSPPVTVVARPLPARFEMIQGQSPAARANRGEAPPAGSTVVFRNVGDAAGTLELQALGGFFTVDPAGPLSVVPGEDATVGLVFSPGSTEFAGVMSGELAGRWSAPDGDRSVSGVVTLTVLEAPGEPTAGARLLPLGSGLVTFRQVGGNPDPQPVAIRNTGTVPVRIAPAIGPGGSWLSIRGDFASPLPPGSERSFDLVVDRARRSTSDGPPPLSTLVRIDNVDGRPEDAAVFEVVDEEPPPSEPGAGRSDLGDADFSVIMGSSVSTTPPGGRALSVEHTGAQFLSDGWIRNRGSDPVEVDLYYTPEGLDGQTDGRVRKNTVSIPAYGAYRLSDFVRGLFEESGSGRVEIRSAQLPQLSIRSTVDSVTVENGVPRRYGAELPLLVSGDGLGPAAGTGPAAFALLTGLKGPLAGSRTNVIFAETLGAPAQVRARLFDVSGRRIGEKTVFVNAYSKAQVSYDDPELFPVPYADGTLELRPAGGGGAVVAFATVLDNVSESYTVRVAALLERPAPTARAVVQTGTGFVPTVERTATADAFYTTRLTVTNGSDADASLKVTWVPEPGYGAPAGPVTLVVPGPEEEEGGPKTVVFADVLKELMGVERNTRGMLRFEGAIASLVFSTETTTPLDLEDPDAGRSVSSVSPAPGVTTKFLGVFTRDSQEAVGLKQSTTDPVKQEVSHPSIEESSAFRTNLVLAEVASQPAKVRVRLRKTGGATLGEPLVVSLVANERIQIDRIALAVLKPASGVVEVKDVEIAVEAIEGKGRVVALAAKVSTDPLSKQSSTYVLGPPVTGSASRGGKK